MSNGFIEVGGRCGEYFRRNVIYPLGQRMDAVSKIRGLTGGSDMYYCTYIFDQQARGEGTKYYSPLYFDLDGDIRSDEGFEALRLAVLSLTTNLCTELRLRREAIKFYFSGGKGFHLFISPRVLQLKPHEKLNMIFKVFVQYMKNRTEHGELIDTKIYDNKRLIRMPNSVNRKTGLYKIPIQYSELRTITRKALLEKAKAPQQEYLTADEAVPQAAARFREIVRSAAGTVRMGTRPKRDLPATPRKLPICMKHLLKHQIPQGGRNDYLAMLASLLVQNGYQDAGALEILYAWNDNNAEPLEDREIQITYESVARNAREGRGYGCSSIREKGAFPPRKVCPHCWIYKVQRRR